MRMQFSFYDSYNMRFLTAVASKIVHAVANKMCMKTTVNLYCILPVKFLQIHSHFSPF